MRLIGRGVGRIELDGRPGERTGEVTNGSVSGAAEASDGLGRVLRCREVEGTLVASILDANQLPGRNPEPAAARKDAERR